MSDNLDEIFGKIAAKAELSKEEAVSLLSLPVTGEAYYRLLYHARKYGEETFGNRGYVFAQIGINAEPCSVNCKFCSMAREHYVLPDRWRKTAEEVAEGVKQLVSERVSDIFLMTTADYPVEQFIEIGKSIRPYIPSDIRLVANIGDFDLATARGLKEAGLTGAYHIVRMREGVDTGLSVQQRVQTLDAIRDAGLELYYCVEPIGPEHSCEEIAEEIFRVKEYRVQVMSAMRRTPVDGTPLFKYGAISTPELCKIAAVALLTVRPRRAMNVHEVTEMSLLAGINQLYAEAGANPRDTDDNTENNRGFNTAVLRAMLENSGYAVQ
jgi:biotin synthase